MLKNILHNVKLLKRHFSASPVKISATNDPSNFTDTLQIHDHDQLTMPTYRVMDESGRILNKSDLLLDNDTLVSIYKNMSTMNEMDKVLYEAQRQGRISFYMTNYGEQAVVGAAAALRSEDLIFPQYREAGVLLWRGYTLDEFLSQCTGNSEDLGRGKQMPVHYGSKKLRYVTVSSPIATQIPQAVGSAYAYKLAKNNRIVLTFFGEGASSEGDAHAGLNFAATLQCPIIFFCRNNGYAISTPAHEQYRQDGLAVRAAGYGIASVRADGNDVLAIYNAVRLARAYVVRHQRPVLLEALTYRKGHHSTSDDSSAYRTNDEVCGWDKLDPVLRLKLYLSQEGIWNDILDTEFKESIRNDVIRALSRAEKIKKPNWQEMFYDVYHEQPENLREQMTYMENHLKKYGQHYPLKEFEK